MVDFPGGPRDLFPVFGDLRRVMGCMISSPPVSNRSPPAIGMLTGCNIHLRQKNMGSKGEFIRGVCLFSIFQSDSTKEANLNYIKLQLH